jgi:uncharacterized protein
MNKALRFLILSLLGIIVIYTPVSAQVDIKKADEDNAIVDQKVMMPMRDGIRLATDIYRPKTNKPVPVIFSRTPYNYNSWGNGEERKRTYKTAMGWVKKGYAYVVQNERGRYFSQGNWDILGTPTTDGDDAFTWLADQPWCNGKIATVGCSSTAEWQMAVAAQDHPAYAAMIPAGYGAGVGVVPGFYEQGNWYRGGAMQMLFTSWLYNVQNDEIRPTFPADATQEQLIRASRYFDLAPERPKVDWSEGLSHLPVKDIIRHQDGPVGIYEEMIKRKPNDPAWFEGGLFHDKMPFGVPSLWLVSWFDVSTGPNIALFNHVRKNGVDEEIRNSQYLIIAPTLHCGFWRAKEETMVGDLNVGDARLDYEGISDGWLDYWLKGEENGFLDTFPRIQYYTMGKNQWQTANTWPPEEIEMTTFYLNSNGKANSLFGDGKLMSKPSKEDKADAYTYDPFNPVPSYGGNVCCTGNAIKGGSYDQSQMETRNDILVYTTETFKEGVEVSGFIETTLYVSSDAKDTDFTIKLIDVYPDGSAFNLDETILRARYREGFDKEVFMKKGEIYKLDLSAMSTSNYFAPGHSLRIEVSSSNFPRFDRNLNTGGNNYDESEGVQAHNMIHHSTKYPSQIRVPIMKVDDSQSKN